MKTFQAAVKFWQLSCFGQPRHNHRRTRALRFLEEAVELVQACDINRQTAGLVLDYVYGRPVGKIGQEIGGTLVTLAGLATAHEEDLDLVAQNIMKECWERIDAIREKNKLKPDFVI